MITSIINFQEDNYENIEKFGDFIDSILEKALNEGGVEQLLKLIKL